MVPEYLPAPTCLQYVLCYRQSILKKRGLSIYEKLYFHYSNFPFKNNIYKINNSKHIINYWLSTPLFL